jgi:tetratricopeptide (TPR) repeat protein
VDQVLQLAEENDDPVLLARALVLQLSLRPSLDGVEAQRRAWTQRVVELGRLSRRPDFELTALGSRAGLDLMRGDRADLDATADEIRRLARELRIPYARTLETVLRCLYAQLEGRLEEAEREAFETAKVQARFQISSAFVGAILSLQLWWLALLRGRHDPILQLMERQTASFSPMHAVHLFIARLQVEAGRLDAARETLERLTPVLPLLPHEDSWIFGVALAAEVCARVGDRARAAELHELLLPHADVGMIIGAVVICTGSVARPLGSLAALLGRADECDALFEKALAHADRLRSPVLRAWTELDYARALRGRSQSSARTKRRKLLASVLESAERLGMHGAVEGARKQLDG